MRHNKHTAKFGRTSAHRQSMMANMLKALVTHGRIKTTVTKAKELRRHADRLITLAKGNDLHAKKQAFSVMRLTYNTLTPKEQRAHRKTGDTSAFNDDRHALKRLFDEILPRMQDRQGGYTRILKGSERIGDGAQRCIIEFV